MRILHTSDWHLGRRFGEHSLLGEQERFCDWLVELVAEEGIDLVAVAGDLFDRAIPPAEAASLLGDTFSRLRRAGVMVAAISGNHDSAERLSAYDGLLAREVHLKAGYVGVGRPEIVSFPDGELAIIAAPYLDPHLVPPSVHQQWQAEADAECELAAGAARRVARTHERALSWALGRARSELPSGTPSIVLSHAFVTGAAPSGSERELAVGEAGLVSAELFAGFDYVALGHLHRAQRVAGTDNIRYSGSPLPYSFSDVDPKRVVVVDVDPTGAVTPCEVEIGVGKGVTTVRGTLEQLEAGAPDAAHWVRAELTDELRPLDAMRRLRGRFPSLVEVDWVGGRSDVKGGLRVSDLRRRSPLELTAEFWVEATGEEPSEAVGSLLADLFDPRPISEGAAA